ncbi:hypothetical protein ILUMI_00746 [Ignelater luminosus]|uniref:Uncharacterized protein n=1 Tax=Ignelater luminosus TaxID=2038154 RepID=A0A8K0GMC1_IGNLU|nr:hypothetical protein ILUMI_00746 [Ignelater luminosus]
MFVVTLEKLNVKVVDDGGGRRRTNVPAAAIAVPCKCREGWKYYSSDIYERACQKTEPGRLMKKIRPCLPSRRSVRRQALKLKE